jgi:acetyl-CoA acetyltransferase
MLRSGIAEFAPERKPSRTWMGVEAYAELARQALEDAGIPLAEVDGMMTGTVAEAGSLFTPGLLAEYLGIRSGFSEVVDLGGAAGAGAVLRAAMAIEAGLCETAICMLHTLPRPPNPLKQQGWIRNPWGSPQAEFDYIYGAIGQNYAYATIANRYAYEYGLKPEQLADRGGPAHQRDGNPKAVFRTPIDIDDVLNSPMIVDPLHMLEIVMPCFGGAAVVVTSRERAKRAKNRPAYIIGGGENTTHLSITYEEDMMASPIKAAADRAFAMAGVKRSEVDMASLYDCYTITVLMTIEDAGFCGKGEGPKFVESTT